MGCHSRELFKHMVRSLRQLRQEGAPLDASHTGHRRCATQMASQLGAQNGLHGTQSISKGNTEHDTLGSTCLGKGREASMRDSCFNALG